MNLHRLRVKRKLSQYGLAKEAGVSREYIRKLESGQHDPTVGMAERLANALGVPVAALLDERAEEATVSIGSVWRRIEANAGRTFHQIRGGDFTYAVSGGHVVPDRTEQQIPRSHFEQALRLVPIRNTVPVQHLRGPSYIYAILMDHRIRQGDW